MPTRSIGCFSADKIVLVNISSKKIHIPKNKKKFFLPVFFNIFSTSFIFLPFGFFISHSSAGLLRFLFRISLFLYSGYWILTLGFLLLISSKNTRYKLSF